MVRRNRRDYGRHPAWPLLGSLRHEVSHPNQVVCRRREGAHPSKPVRSPELGLALQRHGLPPTEDFLHAFPLARRIAFVLRRPPVHRASPPVRHMRSHLHAAQFFHEPFGVVTTISTQRHSSACRLVVQHRNRGVALRGSARQRQARVHHQTVAVRRGHMPQIG